MVSLVPAQAPNQPLLVPSILTWCKEGRREEMVIEGERWKAGSCRGEQEQVGTVRAGAEAHDDL